MSWVLFSYSLIDSDLVFCKFINQEFPKWFFFTNSHIWRKKNKRDVIVVTESLTLLSKLASGGAHNSVELTTLLDLRYDLGVLFHYKHFFEILTCLAWALWAKGSTLGCLWPPDISVRLYNTSVIYHRVILRLQVHPDFQFKFLI